MRIKRTAERPNNISYTICCFKYYLCDNISYYYLLSHLKFRPNKTSENNLVGQVRYGLLF